MNEQSNISFHLHKHYRVAEALDETVSFQDLRAVRLPTSTSVHCAIHLPSKPTYSRSGPFLRASLSLGQTGPPLARQQAHKCSRDHLGTSKLQIIRSEWTVFVTRPRETARLQPVPHCKSPPSRGTTCIGNPTALQLFNFHKIMELAFAC